MNHAMIAYRLRQSSPVHARRAGLRLLPAWLIVIWLMATGSVWAATPPEGLSGSDWQAIQTRLPASARGATTPATFQQAYLKASNTDVNDEFGYSVAISGDTVVVGALRERSSATGVNGDQSDNSATDSGAVYVSILDTIFADYFESAALPAYGDPGIKPTMTKQPF